MTVLVAGPKGDFETALASDEPSLALRGEVRNLLDGGFTPDAALGLLSEFRERLLMEHRDGDEELVCEVMDVLAGWTGPYAKL